ncbi:TPA: hypothetical protein JBF73_07830 [Legionella pneumophila]|nr:hypothetical protein [Legionella pneumophila]
MISITKDLGVFILIGLLLLWRLIAGMERFAFFNSNQYPDFMVNKKISLDSKKKLHKLNQLTCPDGNDIVEKKGAIYVRCGLLWPLTQIWKISIINTHAKN